MSVPTFSPTRAEFTQWVHDALGRLYDLPHPRAHQLADLFADEDSSALQRTQALRKLLLEAIRGLRPAPGTPAQSLGWRAYRILELRYIEGLDPVEAMKEIGLEKSQFFRDQARALDALADVLWHQWEAIQSAASGEQLELAHQETERLRLHATWETVGAAELLGELKSLVAPLAEAQGSEVEIAAAQHLTIAGADRVMLRQAILNVLTLALHKAGRGRVQIGGFADGRAKGIQVSVQCADVDQPAGGWTEAEASLNISRQLMQAMGGTLSIHETPDGLWEARLAWSTGAQPALLVVDDNKGFVDLVGRYLAGHDWRVVGANSGAEAREILAELSPAAIVLDVMMPQEDGWELLMSLKRDWETSNVPVIVCSVLNEPQLALSLGAAAYLPKPVSQQMFLRVLSPYRQEVTERG